MTHPLPWRTSLSRNGEQGFQTLASLGKGLIVIVIVCGCMALAGPLLWACITPGGYTARPRPFEFSMPSIVGRDTC